MTDELDGQALPDRLGAHGARVVFDRLEKRYGTLAVVDGISLDVAPGEFLTLLGPSGSGKTTSLMMLAGFEIPTAGEIYVDDQPIAAVPPYRRNIGMVFQSYALFPHLTVGENIAFPLKLRGLSKGDIARRTAEALDLVRLPGYEHRYPRQLSGGQQQRIAVARALVFNPRVLLMDEPLGALDKLLRENLQYEIKHLHDRLGVTIVYVTHDQQEALVMSNRIAVMNQGRIEQVGTPTELYDEPATRFVASFIGESNFVEGRVVEAKDDVCTFELTGSGVIRAPTRDGVAPGVTMAMTVRPEKIVVIENLEDPPGDMNVIVGTIANMTFVGENRRYEVSLRDDQRLVLKRQHRAGMQQFAPGDQVRIAWHLEDTRLV